MALTDSPSNFPARQRYAQMLLMQGMKDDPIIHPLQGVARGLASAYGGYLMNKAEDDEKASTAKMWETLLGGGAAPATAPGAEPTAPAAPMPVTPRPPGVPMVQEVDPGQFNSIDAMASPAGKFDPNTIPMLSAARRSIAGIESGGNYGAVGPMTASGDQGLGAQQVMGRNVGPWTKETFGQPMTPQAFLKNPDAQDAVFNTKFGQLAQKHGPVGAAKAWFAGERGMNNPNASDVNGTTVSSYADRFNAGMPVRTAALGGGVPATPQAAPQGQQVAQAQPMPIAPPTRSTPQVPPDVAAKIRQLAAGGPAEQRAAMQLIAPYLKPSEPKFHKFDDETLFDERTGKTMSAGPGYKSLVDPAERAKFGIPEDDKRPYQVRGGKLINPPPETRLNIDQRAESTYDQTNLKHFADLNHQIPKQAAAARGKIATLDRLGQLLADPTIHTGAGGALVLDAKRLAKAAGIDVGDLGGAEAVRSIQNQYALELRNPSGGAGMPGAMSDQDRAFLQSIPPGLERTREGNAEIGKYLKKIEQRSLDVERLRQNYVKKNKRLDDGFYQELSDFADKNPLFPEPSKVTPAASSVRPDLKKKYGLD